jgi:hypothetical protein
MIFRTYGRDAGSGLYITFNIDGEWSIPHNMGKEINKTGAELCPMLDPDGKYFFFTSSHIKAKEKSVEKWTYQKIKDEFVDSYKYPATGRNDIYWVDAKIIDNYRKNQ